MVETLKVTREDRVLVLTIDRANKRNALDDATVSSLAEALAGAGDDIGCAVLTAEGEHFSAGLDLNELRDADTFGALASSRRWHRYMDAVQFGPVPVVSALHGAVIGGGLELAAATHIRVADRTAFFALPEGARGVYVGGGGTGRLPRLMGTARMLDLMLTGRVLTADEGERVGLVQYLVDEGTALDKALELARAIAGNARMTNFALTQLLPQLADASQNAALAAESVMAALARSDVEAQTRLTEFLDGRAARVRPGTTTEDGR
ncbi:MAG: crotonase/enoyl-CoA hydratase family protein [Actinomycetales bacterium]